MSDFSPNLWFLNKQREALQLFIEIATKRHQVTQEDDYLLTARTAESMLKELNQHKQLLDETNAAKLRQWAEKPEFQHLRIYLEMEDYENRKDNAI